MDLNLVRSFVTIYEARSLTLAADHLFVTASAVSQALARLRADLDDPLFDRAGREMLPTPFARSIFPQFRDALESIDGAVGGARTFDPASTDRVFRIALSELGEIGWISRIFAAVHAQAPGIRIEVVPLSVDMVEDWLGRGIVDLAITPAQLPARFERSHVKSQRYAVVMSKSNPLAAQPLTVASYEAAAHLNVASDSGSELLDLARRRAEVHIEPALTTQHFATLPAVLAASPALLATVPETIARGWASAWPISILKLPFDMEPIELSLYRRSSAGRSAALDWFYNTVSTSIEGSDGEFDAIAWR